MAQLFKQVNYQLNTLIQNIDMGVIGLPDIQRPFKWPDTKVRDLFDSMYRGYPVGFLVFWANGNQDNVRVIGTDEKQKSPSLLIVDGQQRLTSLFAVIKGHEIVRENFIKDKIVISFNPLTETFIVPDAATKKSSEYIQNITEIWDPKTNIFTLANSFISEFQKKQPLSVEQITIIQNSLSQLKNLESYPFSALELAPSINEEAAADIFVKINSQGQVLNTADFILTLMSVYWDEGRDNLENFSRESKIPTNQVSPFNYIIQPDPDQLLRCSVGYGFRRARLQNVYNILRGKNLETEEFSEELRDQQFEKLKSSQGLALDITTWHEFLKSLNMAGFLRGDIISSDNAVLFAYIFFLIGKHDYNLEFPELKKLIAKWFFFTSITGRYTGSPETVMEGDLTKLRTITTKEDFVKTLENIIESVITPDFWGTTVPNNLATSSPRSPELFAYYASLVVLGAKGLFSRSEVRDLIQAGLKSNKSPLEKHHLFPRAYLEKIGILSQTERNQISNYALVEWSDNIEISDDPPTSYVPRYKSRFNEQEISTMYYWHALPENWENMEYQEFLSKRRLLIPQVIKEAFEKL